MIGKIIGAEVGRRLAKNQSPLVGALIGAAAPWLVRRAFTPAGIVIAGGAFAAKKLYEKKQERDRAKVRLDDVIQSGPARAQQSTPAPQPTAHTSSAGAETPQPASPRENGSGSAPSAHSAQPG